jgi:hypothetical protein
MLQSHVASKGFAARLRGDNEPPGSSASVTWHATDHAFKGCIVLPKTGDSGDCRDCNILLKPKITRRTQQTYLAHPCTFTPQISCSIKTCGFIHRVLGQEVIAKSQMQNPLDLLWWFPQRASLIARPKKKHLKGPKPAMTVSVFGDVWSKMLNHIETRHLGI